MSRSVTRRHFLMSAATAAAAPAVLRAPRPASGSASASSGSTTRGPTTGASWPTRPMPRLSPSVTSMTGSPPRPASSSPRPPFFTDFRKMIDAKGLDAVLLRPRTTRHFHVTHMALSNGLHAYCEKPLTTRSGRRRILAELAAQKKLVTQMGTQIHAGDNYRRVVEIILPGRHRAGPGGALLGRRGVHRGTEAAGRRSRCRRGSTGTCGSGRRRSGRTRSGVRPVLLAAVLGVRRRQDGGHGLPPRGPAVLGPRPAPSDQGQREGAPVTAETRGRLDRLRVRIPGPRRQAAGHADLVRRRQAAAALRREVAAQAGDGTLLVGEKGMLLAGRRTAGVARRRTKFKGRGWGRFDPEVDRPSQGVDRGDQHRRLDDVQLPLLGC